MVLERDDSLLYEKITNYDPDQAEVVIRDLIHCAVHYGMVGFAANQLGINQRICIVLNPGLIVLKNPKIVKVSKQTTTDREGCFSLPGYEALIPRHSWVEVRHEDSKGSVFSGYSARVIQHEVDHLNGITIKKRVDSGQKGAIEIRSLEYA